MRKAAVVDDSAAPVAPSLARDVLELAKPRITMLELIMMFGGMALAPVRPGTLALVGATVGTALVVAAANALNMFIERDSDRLMERTRQRPLPAGRLRPQVALAFSGVCLLLSMVCLFVLVNPLTGLLGLLGFASYGFVYTPLKRRSALALAIGAIPGAVPALMGWTAATGTLDAVGLIYAGILFFWQIPHFLAIAMYRSREYAAAELVVTPNVVSETSTRVRVVAYTIALVAVSLLLVPTGAAGWLYLTVAGVLGAWLLGLTVAGVAGTSDNAVAGRRIFIASLIYLPILALGLVVDVVVVA